MEEARCAVRNFNGVKIREKILKVSFAKFDRKGMPWSRPILQEGDNDSEGVGIVKKSVKVLIVARSFKEVVEGLSQHLKVGHWMTKNTRKMVGTDANKDRKKLDKECLEGMTPRLVEEIFSSTNPEEVKWKR